jgi:hypothetical protein
VTMKCDGSAEKGAVILGNTARTLKLSGAGSWCPEQGDGRADA